jgi:hypothetical protein
MAQLPRSIDEKIAAGEYYDAQQMVKTLHRRLCAKRKHEEADKLCVESAARFSLAGQHELAVDLGKDLVSSLATRKEEPADENLALIEAILQDIPSKVASHPKYALMHQALKWSSASAACSTGHPRLHRLAAMSHWADGDFGKCQGHFVFCGDGPGLAEMLRAWRTKGYANEQDLFSLRLLLILLSLNDIATARSFWDDVNEIRLLPAAAASSSEFQTDQALASVPSASSSSSPAQVPVPPEEQVPEAAVQCGTFLLAAAEGRNLQFFRCVRAKYLLVFRRDPTFNTYLDEVEAKVFGIQAQPQGIGAFFDLLLGSAAPD